MSIDLRWPQWARKLLASEEARRERLNRKRGENLKKLVEKWLGEKVQPWQIVYQPSPYIEIDGLRIHPYCVDGNKTVDGVTLVDMRDINPRYAISSLIFTKERFARAVREFLEWPERSRMYQV